MEEAVKNMIESAEVDKEATILRMAAASTPREKRKERKLLEEIIEELETLRRSLPNSNGLRVLCSVSNNGVVVFLRPIGLLLLPLLPLFPMLLGFFVKFLSNCFSKKSVSNLRYFYL